MSKIDHTLGAGLGTISPWETAMRRLLKNTRQSWDVECKQNPIFENRGSIYMTGNYAHRCNADGSFDSICLPPSTQH